jgi:hypothetical protein
MVERRKVIHKVKELTAQLAAGDLKKATEDPTAPSWIGHVAVLTGVLAALTGFLAVRATTLTNAAIYESNQAILSQSQASDAWSEYQANSIKAHMVEMQLLPSNHLSAADRAKLDKMDKDFRDRQPVSREKATGHETDRETHLKNGLKKLEQKDLLEYAGMVAQLGIALASVAALVRKRIAFDVAIAAAVVALAMTGYVFLF